MSTFFMTKDFIAASIIIVKNTHYREDFATISEINVVSNALQQRFNDEGINIIITDGIDQEYFFVYSSVCIKKINKTMEDLKNRYQGYGVPFDALTILYDEDFILECIDELRKPVNADLSETVKAKRVKINIDTND